MMVRQLNNKMNISRKTIYNWFVKGSKYLNKVLSLSVLKDKLLAKVNTEAKITVFFYDEVTRGRQMLHDFLDKTEIDALQSDGSNVYVYLDKEFIDVYLPMLSGPSKGKV